MEKKVYGSMTEEVKALINDFMATVEGGECERKEIVAFIKEHISNKETLTDGVVAGAIKIMVANNELVVVQRARYKKGVKAENQSMKEKVIALLENFQKDLSKVTTVSLMEVSSSDIEFIKKINEISNQLESEIWKLDEVAEDKTEQATAEPEKENKKANKAIPV